MSQNLSKMSDIYIPELIELDSYWQKAVEDAIYDTLKGEKRLYYALRNRKKINEKLEKLGLKPVYSQTSFLGRYQFSAQSLESRKNLNYERCKSSSNTEWDSYEENSSGSLESAQNEGVCSQEVLEPNRASFSPVGSKSKSKDRKETPPEKIYRNPERPILGNGSLEKMKKSQNSFYCEPMGPEDGMLALTEEIISDCDKKKEPTQTVSDSIMKDEKNKKVEWLHFREGKAFEDSDTEMSSNELSKEKMQNDEHQTNLVDKDANFYCEQKSAQGTSSQNSLVLEEEMPKIPMTLDLNEDLFWETEVKNAIRENVAQERKLYFALAKREIVNENMKNLQIAKDDYEIQINKSVAKLAAKKRQSKKFLSPFIKFYLEVYRELCHKYPVQQIAAEASARWWRKSLKQKSKFQK